MFIILNKMSRLGFCFVSILFDRAKALSLTNPELIERTKRDLREILCTVPEIRRTSDV